jgi:hypothetical protein
MSVMQSKAVLACTLLFVAIFILWWFVGGWVVSSLGRPTGEDPPEENGTYKVIQVSDLYVEDFEGSLEDCRNYVAEYSQFHHYQIIKEVN